METYALARKAHDELNANGGASLTLDGESPTAGYMVAVRGHEYVTKTVTVETIARYIRENKAALELPGRYLGLWQAPDAVYIDIAKNWQNKESAKRHARQIGELAIWQVAPGKEIRVS